MLFRSRVPGVTGYRNPPETRKLWVITHKHGKKCLKSRVLPPLESCTWGHRASKSSRNRKLWVITHENGQKWLKTQGFLPPLESRTWGHMATKSSQEPKIMGHNPRKLPEMLEITSFAQAARVVYRGSRGNEILVGTENRGL